jgi:hypothetical protein
MAGLRVATTAKAAAVAPNRAKAVGEDRLSRFDSTEPRTRLRSPGKDVAAGCGKGFFGSGSPWRVKCQSTPTAEHRFSLGILPTKATFGVVRRFFLLALFALLAYRILGNPIALDVPVECAGEDVTVHVGRAQSEVKGAYTFRLTKDAEKPSQRNISFQLPVFVPDGDGTAITASVQQVNAVLRVGPRTFHPSKDFAISRKTPNSAITMEPDGGVLVYFFFSVPRKLLASEFIAAFEYNQPHLASPQGPLAIYCPILPPWELGQGVDLATSKQFKIRFKSEEKVRLRRISQNRVVRSESGKSVEVGAQHLESIVAVVEAKAE